MDDEPLAPTKVRYPILSNSANIFPEMTSPGIRTKAKIYIHPLGRYELSLLRSSSQSYPGLSLSDDQISFFPSTQESTNG
jgi:hypothetical protein